MDVFMKRYLLSALCIWLFALAGAAQQVMYASLRELVEEKGDTLTTLRVEKRTWNQRALMGGSDYRVTAVGNPGLCKYLKKHCYAVRVDSALYVNCKRMRYKRYRFGNWYASALRIKGRIFFRAQPVGQVAAGSAVDEAPARLGGEVGDAIAASGLVGERVYYELDTKTGRAYFLDKERMMELLEGDEEMGRRLAAENGELAGVIGKYLEYLKKKEEKTKP